MLWLIWEVLYLRIPTSHDKINECMSAWFLVKIVGILNRRNTGIHWFLMSQSYTGIPCLKLNSLKNMLIGSVSKTGVGATLPGVQIPLSPPLFKHLPFLLSVTHIPLRKTNRDITPKFPSAPSLSSHFQWRSRTNKTPGITDCRFLHLPVIPYLRYNPTHRMPVDWPLYFQTPFIT